MNKIVKYKEYIILCISIFIICISMFGKVLFSDYEFLPPDSYSAKAVEKGFYLAEDNYDEYPLWLPWMFSGLPSVHSFQNISEYYYPYKIFKLFRDVGVLRFYEFIFHFIFAGLGMFILLRRIECNSISSAFSSFSYVTMPYLVANLIHGHGSLVMTASYIPWIIWALINLFDRRNFISVGFLGVLIGFQLQRAHVQIAYYTWMMIGLYVLFFIVDFIYNKKQKFLSIKLNPLLFLFSSLILGIALSASIYFPAISYMNDSTRGAIDGGMGLTQAMGWSFPPIESIVFLLPSFFGFGGYTYWGYIEFTDYPQYMGIIVLIFALYSYFSSKKIKYFIYATLIFALLISFGRYLPFFYNLFYDFFPLFNKFRVPMYILILVQFSTAILAGIGLNEYMINIKNQKATKKLFKIVGIICSLSTLIFLFKTYLIDYETKNMRFFGVPNHEILDPIRLSLINQSFYIFLILMVTFICVLQLRNKLKNNSQGIPFIQNIFPLMILLLSLLDISIINYKIINPNKDEYRITPLTEKKYLDAYFKKDGVINFLLNDSSKYRVWPINDLERTNRWSAFNIESVSGYHPAKLNSYDSIIKSTGFMMPSIMKTLNIKYIISSQKMLDSQIPDYLELVFSGSLYSESKKQYITSYIYQYKDYYTRLYFSKNIIQLDQGKQISKLKDYYFNPKEVSMVSEEPADVDIDYDSMATAEFIDWSPNTLIIKTNAKSEQFLNISEVFYPKGWTVHNMANNESLKIYKVNNLIRGIFIEPGQNLYFMSYDPIENKYGSIISATSFIVLLLLIIIGFKNEN